MDHMQHTIASMLYTENSVARTIIKTKMKKAQGNLCTQLIIATAIEINRQIQFFIYFDKKQANAH